MKRLIFALLGVSVLAGLVVYIHARAPQPGATTPSAADAGAAPAIIDESPATQARSSNQEVSAPPPQLPSGTSPATASALPVAAAPNPALDASLVSRTVDTLVSSQAGYLQKRELWKQLRDSGRLDQAIADLEQRTTTQPRVAEFPAALGQAYLQKCATITDVREQGILAMQADKVFDTALSLDPSNWEARFTKAVALSYWPPMLNKGDEVIQHFQTLIQQQEAQTPQPQFAETYAWLGDQYQKTGRTEDARAVWQRGAALFPSDEKLRGKLAPAQ